MSQGRETNERWWDAELHRLRAELLLAGGPEAAEAEAALRRALEIARGQQARSLELRAARALAGLWAGSGRTADARDLLAPVYSSFTAGAFTMSFRKREHHDAGAGFVQASQGGLASTFGKTEVEFSQPGRQGDIAATTTGFGAVFSDVPQPISLFAKEEWPIRLHVLLDGSGSMEAALPVAKRAARRLVRTLRPGDEAEIAQFSRYLSVLQESTGDLAALERAIERVSLDGETALRVAPSTAVR